MYRISPDFYYQSKWTFETGCFCRILILPNDAVIDDDDGTGMKFIVFLYIPKTRSVTEAEQRRLNFGAFTQKLIAQGVFAGGNTVLPGSRSINLHHGDISIGYRANGRLTKTNPWHTAKQSRQAENEQMVLDGFYILDCWDIRQAIEICRQIPEAEHSSIEIRKLPAVEHSL